MLSFLAIVVEPVSLYFLLVHPDWSWLYLLDGAALPGWAIALALAALGAALVGGYLGGSVLLRKRGERALFSACGAAAAALLLFVLVAHGRVLAYGTTAEFRRGEAASLFEVKFVWILCICAVGTTVAAVAVALNLLSLGRPRNSRR